MTADQRGPLDTKQHTSAITSHNFHRDDNNNNNDKNHSCAFQGSHEANTSLPETMESCLKMTYRSVGLGLFGATMRFIGMPLEKIALFMNSAQVSSGKGSLAQAVNLTFQKGIFTPYRVVSPTSGLAWFLQYSVMGMVFQSVDKSLSLLFHVPLMPYGSDLMKDPRNDIDSSTHQKSDDNSSMLSSSFKMGSKMMLAPILSGTIESVVANRAEVQRYYGIHKLSQVESQLQHNLVRKLCGPAFIANSSRNAIMSCTSFVVTPILYRNYFPQESKNKSTLFWFGLGVNIFLGNVIAITQQSLWGRALDYSISHEKARNIHYSSVIRQGLNTEGYAAFFTIPKFFSRVLMNAPVQGTLPWFYNEILPVFEPGVIVFCTNLYQTQLKKTDENHRNVYRSHDRLSGKGDENDHHGRLNYTTINHDVTSSRSSSSSSSNSSSSRRNGGTSIVQATSAYDGRTQ